MGPEACSWYGGLLNPRFLKFHTFGKNKPSSLSLVSLLWKSQTETRDTKAFQEVIFTGVPAAAQQIHIQRLSPENRGLTLYTLASRLQKQKARFNPFMVPCNSIGYFTPSAM
jgi:hypothetical protein